MLILLTRKEYERRLRATAEATFAECHASQREFAESVRSIANDEVGRIQKFAAEAIERAEQRAQSAEDSLRRDREQFSKDVRHMMSMFLRREKSYPLPPTKEEKEEAKVAEEERGKAPQPLTDVQIAMRDANRREAARCGVSQEEADRDFEQKILKQMME